MPDYPRELNLDTATTERLVAYLESELLNHYAERQGHLDDLLKWQKDYWAKPTTEKATFPFTGAATIVIPLSAIAVEAIHARTMTTMFALPQFVTAQAVSAEWYSVATAFERFMDRELLVEMKARKTFSDCFLEAEKFGTMIGKTGYQKVIKTAVREVNGYEQEIDVVTKAGACFDSVADARFLMPNYANDPQLAPWCGEEHSATGYELRQMENSGLFKRGTYAKIEPFITKSRTGSTGQETGMRFEANQQDLEKTAPSFPERIDWVELWMGFDVDESGRDKEIVVHYHRLSKTIMSIKYNWYYDLRRPYRTNVYFPVEHRWRGIGICKQNEQFQREVTTQHRQRLDNATLANMRMIKVSKLTGYGPKEPIFPGKMWFVDDMDHVDSFQLGEIYPSSYSNEQATLIYHQQRIGINDLTLGMTQSGTPGTATSDLARLKEGNKKFDFVYANFKEFTNEIINDIAANIQQFGAHRVSYFDVAENGQLVKQYFEMPNEAVHQGLLISLKAAGEQQNDIVDRQNWTQIATILQQYFVGLTQLAMPLGNPELLQLIFTRGLGAATEAMRQILESYPNVRNADRMIVKELEALTNGFAAAGAQPRGAIGPGGVSPQQPLAGPAQGFQGVRENGNGVTNRLYQS
jgi:hypothetical protein